MKLMDQHASYWILTCLVVLVESINENKLMMKLMDQERFYRMVYQKQNKPKGTIIWCFGPFHIIYDLLFYFLDCL